MPPKAKLNLGTGKDKKPLKKTLTDSPQTSTNGPQLSPEAQQQFELELCWCIQQLQIALKSGKLSSKQIQDHTKALNSLMSNSIPLIKKRQIMRLSFNDYREKMAKENKKHNSGTAKIKILPTKPNNKSVFIKKALFNTNNGEFKFNFAVSEQTNEDAITNDMSNIKIEEPPQLVTNNFHFIPSANSFKFNFDVKS